MIDSIKRSMRVVTPPAFEPVTLTEAKLWCRVDDDATDEHATLLLLIAAMRERAEDLTGRAYVQRTLELWLDRFPDDGVIELPFTPVQSVTSVTYVDGDGASQVLSGSPEEWQEDLNSDPALICPLYGESWPATRQVLGAVKVRYVAGYATVNAVPKALRLWIQANIATLFENREQLVQQGVVSIPRDLAIGLLDGLRGHRMFA